MTQHQPDEHAEVPGVRTPDGLRRALGVASEGVPAPDGLAETTWLRGRRVRRRRAALSGVGAAAVLGATVLAWAALGPAGMPGARDAIPAGTGAATSTAAPTPAPTDGSSTPPSDASATTGAALVETTPDPTGDDGTVPVDASEETQEVWGVLRSSCLVSRGYDVVVTGSTLTATQLGAQPGDYSRDTALCDAELVMRLPPVEISFEDGELSPAADAALRAVYDGYVATAGCVRAQGMPVDEAPEADDFVDRFAREWMPSWHPWTAAAAEGSYAEVRSACPVGTP